MKNKIIYSFVLFTLNFVCFAQVKALRIGDSPSSMSPSAALEIASTNKGLLPPRMTNTQMTTITTPVDGLIVFCTDCAPIGMYLRSEGVWSNLRNTETTEATSATKGIIQLTGDLGGTAAAPTVPGLANKENTIAAGTTTQYYRGDKSWQTLNKTAVGLANVDNTTDANKPISTATQTALDTKEATENKSTDITTDATSDEKFPSVKAVKAYVDTQVIAAKVVDANASTKGKIQLAGDLSGTADAPTVPGLANKENIIAAGTTTQYYRGDKSWQTLDKTAVGLANVDNTTDANKPISTAAQTALDTKEAIANKSTDVTTDATSDEKFPSVKAVKTYVDTQVTAATPDANVSTKGKIQLAGDLGGDASAPTIKNNAVTTTKIADANVTESKIASDAITSAKIADNAVTTTKISAGTSATSQRVLSANETGTVSWSSAPFLTEWNVQGSGNIAIRGNSNWTDDAFETPYFTNTVTLPKGKYLFMNKNSIYHWGTLLGDSEGSTIVVETNVVAGTITGQTNIYIKNCFVSEYTPNGQMMIFEVTSESANIRFRYRPTRTDEVQSAFRIVGTTGFGGSIYKVF